MTNEEILTALESIKNPDYQVIKDRFDMARLLNRRDSVLQARMLASDKVREGKDRVLDYYDLVKQTYLWGAKDSFDDYMIYLEWDREPQTKFYQPRRRILKRVTDQLQALEDNNLDELFLSLPARTGKSTIVMFFLTWIMGKHPESSNLYVAFSDTITRALYSGIMEILTDPVTYLWADVFNTCTIADTNSKDETININRHKRYPTLTARSLYGSLNGACDCDGYLVSDDLLSGIEEALNPVRLETAWYHVDNNMLSRAKSGAKKIWIGTRWSTHDPISTRISLLQENPNYAKIRYKSLELPALNEKDESNFNYDYGVGFDTDYYKQRRASFEANNDIASWLAQYQQTPIDRQGTLFEPATMKYYNGDLPDEEIVRVFMACDVAWGGGDYFAAPIAYEFEDGSIYIDDVVYSDGDKSVTRPLVVNKILEHEVDAVQFEANNGGHEYADIVNDELKKQCYRCNITSVPAPTNKKKEIRIFDKAPEIREFYFRDTGCRSKEYTKFMQNMFSFTVTGKNAHEDSVDSLAMLVTMKEKRSYKPEIFKRPF